MRLPVMLLLLASLLPGASLASPPRDAQIANVVAFARLYGVLRYFYPSDTAAGLDWNRFAVVGVGRVRAARDAAELATILQALVTPLGPGIAIGRALPPAPPAGAPDPALVVWRYLGAGVSPPDSRNLVYLGKRTHRPVYLMPSGERRVAEAFDAPPSSPGAHVDVDLGSGLKARVPLALTEAQASARTGNLVLDALVRPPAVAPARGTDVDTNLADVVVAWNVYRHFYPYLPVIAADAKVKWDEVLPTHISRMFDADAATHRALLFGVIADAHDGHGTLTDRTQVPYGRVPLFLQRVEGRIVVAGTGTGEVPLGAEIVSIDGQPIEDRVRDRLRFTSGTTQWRTVSALRQVVQCSKGTAVRAVIDAGSGARGVSIPCGDAPPVTERRPGPVTELEPGLWYVDVSRAPWETIAAALPKLAAARGVVFDLRGYPTDSGFQLLPYLLAAKEEDRWMHVDHFVGPFQQTAGGEHEGWDMTPKTPRVGGNIVFLTDGRAISYAESVMAYVKDRRLGTIIGAPTAGANGNVTRFEVPSGEVVTLTGMRVTRHDGTSQQHLIGVLPDVALAPTIAGIRAGKDELLARAVASIARR